MDDSLSPASHRWVRIVAAAFAVAVVLSVVGPAASSDVDADALEREIHADINDERVAAGVGEIRHHDMMSQNAAGYSKRMGEEGFFSHTPPSGPPKERVQCRPYGENLLQLSDSSGSVDELADRIVGEWMDSEQHRENILNPRWQAEGVGVYADSDVYVTQRFCG